MLFKFCFEKLMFIEHLTFRFAFIGQDNLHTTTKYNHFSHINSTSVEKETGGCRMFSILFIVLSDGDGILHRYLEGHKPPTIARLLRAESVKASCVGILKFLAKFEDAGSIGWRIGSGRPLKITVCMKKPVEDQVCSDNETTAYQLHKFAYEQRLHYLSSHSSALSYFTWVDFQRKCLLPALSSFE